MIGAVHDRAVAFPRVFDCARSFQTVHKGIQPLEEGALENHVKLLLPSARVREGICDLRLIYLHKVFVLNSPNTSAVTCNLLLHVKKYCNHPEFWTSPRDAVWLTVLTIFFDLFLLFSQRAD